MHNNKGQGVSILQRAVMWDGSKRKRKVLQKMINKRYDMWMVVSKLRKGLAPYSPTTDLSVTLNSQPRTCNYILSKKCITKRRSYFSHIQIKRSQPMTAKTAPETWGSWTLLNKNCFIFFSQRKHCESTKSKIPQHYIKRNWIAANNPSLNVNKKSTH